MAKKIDYLVCDECGKKLGKPCGGCTGHDDGTTSYYCKDCNKHIDPIKLSRYRLAMRYSRKAHSILGRSVQK